MPHGCKMRAAGGRDSQPISGLDYWLIWAYLTVCDLIRPGSTNHRQPVLNLEFSIKKDKEIYIF